MNAKLRALMLIAGCTAGGLSMMSCKGGDDQEEFGFTCIELAKGESVDGDPFAGTAKIKVTMFYEQCLINYYTEKHPEQRSNGPEGEVVFSEWKERLCSEDVERRIDCEVEAFEQNINPGGSAPLYNMTITYATQNPDQLAGRRILWGPGPLEAYAECDAGQRPFVKLTGLPDVIGLDGAGTTLWKLQGFGATPRALIKADGSGCLQAPITNEL